jgi:hypothetical protein
MVSHTQLAGRIIISLVLVFSLIHLGVSIGIINTNRQYVGVFHPEVGLSGFNIVIAFFGIAVGSAGLMHLLTDFKIFSRVLLIFLMINILNLTHCFPFHLTR